MLSPKRETRAAPRRFEPVSDHHGRKKRNIRKSAESNAGKGRAGTATARPRKLPRDDQGLTVVRSRHAAAGAGCGNLQEKESQRQITRARLRRSKSQLSQLF